MMFDFSSLERQALSRIGATIFFRMLGLFCLLPVLSVLAKDFEDATPLKIGLAMGLYGLTQALFQIPFGMLSDRFGRKRMAILGLLIFGIGSLYGALADTFTDVVVARFLQGIGAIASVMSAWLSDLLSERNRKMGFMIIGVSISAAFVLSIFLMPIFTVWFGINHIFWGMVGLAVIGSFLLFGLDEPEKNVVVLDASLLLSASSQRAKQVMVICTLGFVAHLMMPALFMIVPYLLIGKWDILLGWHGVVYLSAMLVGLPVLAMIVRRFSRRYCILASFGFLGAGFFLAFLAPNMFAAFFIAMALGLIGFNLLEAILPVWVSEIASLKSRGILMGYLMTSEFLGSFFGGLLGGYFLSFLNF